MPPIPFSQIDHPLIELDQALVVFFMVRLFIAVRHNASPLPQLVLVTAFIVLVNLIGRVLAYKWFYISDIAMFTIWAVVTAASDYAVRHRKKAEADQAAKAIAAGQEPIVKIPAPDFFDRSGTQISWIVGLLVGTLVIGAYLRTYSNQQKLNAQVVAAADKQAAAVKAAEIKKTTEFERKQKTSDSLDVIRQDSVKRELKAISAQQKKLLAGQHGLGEKIDTKSALTRATIKKAVENKAQSTPTKKGNEPKSESEPKPDPEKEPSFLERLRRKIMGRAAAAGDSLGHVSADHIPPSDSLLFR